MIGAPGFFLTLEGGEGAGKSTQAERLAKRLREAGRAVVSTREPGGAPTAEAVRALLLDSEGGFDPLSELMLIAAARHEHLRRTIEPALAEGAVVICDRYMDSTRAYQGVALGLGEETVDAAMAFIGARTPDLTFIFDAPVDVTSARLDARGRSNHYDRRGADFHEDLRRAFLGVAAREPARCAVIDAVREPDVIADEIWARLAKRLVAA